MNSPKNQRVQLLPARGRWTRQKISEFTIYLRKSWSRKYLSELTVPWYLKDELAKNESFKSLKITYSKNVHYWLPNCFDLTFYSRQKNIWLNRKLIINQKVTKLNFWWKWTLLSAKKNKKILKFILHTFFWSNFASTIWIRLWFNH